MRGASNERFFSRKDGKGNATSTRLRYFVSTAFMALCPIIVPSCFVVPEVIYIPMTTMLIFSFFFLFGHLEASATILFTKPIYQFLLRSCREHIPANSAQQRKHTSMDNDDDFVNEDVNEDEYLSEDPDDEEFDINAGNLPRLPTQRTGLLVKLWRTRRRK